MLFRCFLDLFDIFLSLNVSACTTDSLRHVSLRFWKARLLHGSWSPRRSGFALKFSDPYPLVLCSVLV